MTSETSRPTGGPADDSTGSVPPAPPDEPTDDAGLTDDGSVLDDAPDTTTGKQQLLLEDDRPGPGV
jgi:hypothetical protein